jgi:uncharacterized protein YigE (DUF2233 family)
MRIARLLALLLVLAAGPVAPVAADEDNLCQARTFEDALFTICTIDLRESELRLHAADEQGVPLGSFSALEDLLAAEGRRLVFAMNAGMYDEGLKPIVL